MDQITNTNTADSAGKIVSRLGFWVAVFTAIFSTVALAFAIMTPPRSGPFCSGNCISYPYTAAAQFVPNDYIWMYPAILMAPLLVVLVACIHHYASANKKIFGNIALSFAVFSATTLVMDYFIQLTVMQPSFLKGEAEGLSLFSQYNPHGIFIALEDIGYLMMGLVFLFAAAALGNRDRLEWATRSLFVISSVLVIGSLIVLALIFGSNLEYRFEVGVILIDWLTLIFAGVLLSFVFMRAGRTKSSQLG